MQAILTILGSGTSMGVPTLGCSCPVCTSPDPRNRRTRPSIRLEYNDKVVLIDTGQDFHAQALRERITRVDAVLYTHAHADHILGLDDLRPLTFKNPDPLPLYADDETATTIERIFEYTFRKENRYPTSARVQMHRLSTTPGTQVTLFGAKFERIPVTHGPQTIASYRFGKAAYLTDVSDIPPASMPLLEGLDILILDALRRTPHPSHMHLDKSVELVHKLRPKQAFFTHISHDLDHVDTEAGLRADIRLAFDGQQIPFEIAE